MNTTKYFLIGLAGLMILTGTSCTSEQTTPPVDTVTDTSVPVQVTGAYENSSYGFALVFPTSWGTVKEQVGSGDKITSVQLSAENDPARYIKILVVKIADKNDPAVIDYPMKPLTESESYSYYYTANTEDYTGNTELGAIIKSFSLKEVQTQDTGPVSQVFKSENGDFDYTLTWNTELLTLVEADYEGATRNAPSFDITGGGHISLLTGLIDSPGYKMYQFVNANYYQDYADWPTSEPTPSTAGTSYPVYYFDWTADSSCMIKYGVVKGLNEALSVRLEDCDDNDMRSSQAFGDLLSDLRLDLSTPSK